jgi:hypothetical protein
MKTFAVYVMTPCLTWEGVEAKNKNEAIAKYIPEGTLNLPGNFYTFAAIEEKEED